jgi:hypothetical protein
MNNIPVAVGNTTGKFNVLFRHYGPSGMVSKGNVDYNPANFIKKSH